jgi:transposase
MVANSVEALQQQPLISPIAQHRLQQTWHLLDDQVRALEAELLTLLE